MKGSLTKAIKCFLVMTVVLGLLYTAVMTGICQLLFKDKANGSIIEVNGVKYGSALLAQQFTGEEYMWGRIMNLDASTFTDEEGNKLVYAGPSNKTPAGEEMDAMIKERIAELRAAHPDMDETKVPVDLVTCSGSGLDPHISVAAANFQATRLAKNRGISVEEVNSIIKKCTTGKFLGIFGEEVVNVLEVNLMLDGIIEG